MPELPGQCHNCGTPGTWECIQCGETNRMHRQECNNCGAQKVDAQGALMAHQRAKTLERYVSFETLKNIVDQRWVCLLKASFLLELHLHGHRIERHQETSPKAFASTFSEIDDMKDRLFEEWPNVSGRIIALSYRWLEPGHPDRSRHHLNMVAPALKYCIKFFSVRNQGEMTSPPDFFIFWDFPSLPQLPRTEMEERRFQNGLDSLDVVYGHNDTQVWQQPKMPDVQPPLAGYDTSGWCLFESSVSSLQKRKPWYRLDISLLDEEETLDPMKATRKPPLTPSIFSNMLDVRRFTGKGDKEKVKQLYDLIFSMISVVVEELNFDSLCWGDTEFTALATVVNSYSNLHSLVLSNRGTGQPIVTCVGLRALLDAPRVLQLSFLDLHGQTSIGDSGAFVVADALPKANWQSLCLEHCKIGDAGATKLSEGIRASRLQSLEIGFNKISDVGLTMLQGSANVIGCVVVSPRQF